MVDYALTDLIEEKIPNISELTDEFSLETDTSGSSGLASKFDPNEWYKEGIRISVHDTSYPIYIRSFFRGKIITQDPNFPLIKKVVNLLGCKKAVDGGGKPYDMNIFKPTEG